MTAVEVSHACDELHRLIDQGPGLNPGACATSLTIVRQLRAAAEWEYPLELLSELEQLITRWFNPKSPGPVDRDQESRYALLEVISKIEDAWERPRE